MEQVFVHDVIFPVCGSSGGSNESIPCWILVSARVEPLPYPHGKGCAYIKGRNYVVPTDVSDVFKEVAVHRLQLSCESQSQSCDSRRDHFHDSGKRGAASSGERQG